MSINDTTQNTRSACFTAHSKCRRCVIRHNLPAHEPASTEIENSQATVRFIQDVGGCVIV